LGDVGGGQIMGGGTGIELKPVTNGDTVSIV